MYCSDSYGDDDDEHMMHVMLIEVKAMSKGKGKKAGGSHPLVMYVNVWHCMPLHGIAWYCIIIYGFAW